METKKPKYIKIKPSSREIKKLMAVFYDGNKEKIKTIHFGQSGASDMTQHKNIARRDLYDARHRKNENWKNPMTAGTLAKFILWNKPNKKDSINDYIKKFNLKKI